MGRNDRPWAVMYARYTDKAQVARVRNHLKLVGYREAISNGRSAILVRMEFGCYDKVFLMLEQRQGFWEVKP